MSATTAADTSRALPVADDQAALTIASEHKDFADWHRGRRHYALWAIGLPRFDGAIAAMRKHLDAYLLPGYARQAHITLSVCGFPVDDDRGGDDNAFTAADFAAQVAALRLARLSPFSIEIGAPATFSSAAYFAVDDHQGGIARLRRALAGDDQPFVPHLTFGLYRGRFPIAQMKQRMRCCPGPRNPSHYVDRLTLMTYAAAVITGTLTPVCEYDLARQSLRVLDATALDALWGCDRLPLDETPFSN